ncbi:hypothetical protein MLD38_006191 [Melastoma candidum]|uniref:Uncharacterized protein n=1 Tax=Melastoma candidum TaxID=119954 RepID=A0ACB9RMN0_9MYRT|nr:hypothetical protein MLD38_006191 [Melastoma candidum]
MFSNNKEEACYDLVTVLSFSAVFILTLLVYFMSCPRSIYLIDFACYKPSDNLKVSKEQLLSHLRSTGNYDEALLGFHRRILETSGIGDKTYIPKPLLENPPVNCSTMKEGRGEASVVCIFNPTPSFSAMIINHCKMRGNILSYNLGGMGCSAGVIAVDLARDILKANGNSYVVVVGTEMVGFNWYKGMVREMIVPNCFFRMGCSAVMLSNRRRDFRRAKCVYQEEDEERNKGLGVTKDLIEIGSEALKTNITTLGPLVLPFSEQLLFFATLLRRGQSPCPAKSAKATKPYIPDTSWRLSTSASTQRARFGNTSSSSIWYELAYLEAKLADHVRVRFQVQQPSLAVDAPC